MTRDAYGRVDLDASQLELHLYLRVVAAMLMCSLKNKNSDRQAYGPDHMTETNLRCTKYILFETAIGLQKSTMFQNGLSSCSSFPPKISVVAFATISNNL